MAMPTYTVITYTCPRCRTDIGRRFGLITTRTIVCSNCRTKVRIDAKVIQQNWGFNFAWAGTLILWLCLGLGVLADQNFAAMIGRETFPADTFEHRLEIAGVCVIPALLGGLVMGGVGMLLGAIAAAGMPVGGGAQSAPTSAATAPRLGLAAGSGTPPIPASRQGWQTIGAGYYPQAHTAPSAPPLPPQRSFLVRAFFVLLWPVVFFFAAGVVLAVTAVSGAKSNVPPPATAASAVGLIDSPLGQGPLLAAASLFPSEARDEQLMHQAAQSMGEKSAPWLLLGTFLVFGAGCAGLLPWTGRKRQRPAAQPATSGAAMQA
jgi:hypothetical protein